jgi:hypothetical protein
MSSLEDYLQKKKETLNKINSLLIEMEDTSQEKEMVNTELSFKKKKLKSKIDNFDVVSISRPIYWPEKGYYEKITKKNDFFETCYKPTFG